MSKYYHFSCKTKNLRVICAQELMYRYVSADGYVGTQILTRIRTHKYLYPRPAAGYPYPCTSLTGPFSSASPCHRLFALSRCYWPSLLLSRPMFSTWHFLGSASSTPGHSAQCPPKHLAAGCLPWASGSTCLVPAELSLDADRAPPDS